MHRVSQAASYIQKIAVAAMRLLPYWEWFGLWHPNPLVRAMRVRYMTSTPTPKQVERGLCDESDLVREAWARKLDFTPTPQQVERGLTDADKDVRYAWANRTDFIPTPEQIERGLTDPSWQVRVVWNYHPHLVLHDDIIKRGMRDKHHAVRMRFAKLQDFKPSQEHMVIGVSDPFPNVRLFWLKKHEVPLPDACKDALVRDPNIEVLVELTKRCRELNPEHIQILLQNPSEYVRNSMSEQLALQRDVVSDADAPTEFL